jgi:hypothetical protein
MECKNNAIDLELFALTRCRDDFNMGGTANRVHENPNERRIQVRLLQPINEVEERG